jgi:hypothetical protein
MDIVTVFVCVDENGNPLGPPELAPEPDRFRAHGLAQVEPYVARLMASPEGFAALSVFTPDGQRGLGLSRREGVPRINLNVDRLADAEREGAIRAFFTERRLVPEVDHLAGNGGVPEATRCLTYVLPADAVFVATLAREVLVRIYGVGENAALNFSFEERPLGGKPAAPVRRPVEIHDLVAQLLRAPSGSLAIVGTPEAPVGLFLYHETGTPYLSIAFDWLPAPGREAAIRDFFAARNLAPLPEADAEGELTPGAGQGIAYRLRADPASVAPLVRDLLQTVYKLPPDSALVFHIREKRG